MTPPVLNRYGPERGRVLATRGEELRVSVLRCPFSVTAENGHTEYRQRAVRGGSRANPFGPVAVQA